MGEADEFKFGAQNSPSWIRCSPSCHLRYITPTECGHPSQSLSQTHRKREVVATKVTSSITNNKNLKAKNFMGILLCDVEEEEKEMWYIVTLTFSRLRSRFCLSLSFRMLITILCLAPLVTFCGRKQFCVKHPFFIGKQV